MRRALLVVALAAFALAPAVAEARPSLVVSGIAKGYHGGFENMNVQFECAAADIGGAPTYITRCSFGKASAPTTGQCMDCPQPDPPAAVSVGSTNVRLGLPYDLCVTAVSHTTAGVQTVSRCAPFDYLTNTALIAG